MLQLKSSPSMSWMVTLSEEVVRGTAVDWFVGLGVVIVGGLLTGVMFSSLPML